MVDDGCWMMDDDDESSMVINKRRMMIESISLLLIKLMAHYHAEFKIPITETENQFSF